MEICLLCLHVYFSHDLCVYICVFKRNISALFLLLSCRFFPPCPPSFEFPLHRPLHHQPVRHSVHVQTVNLYPPVVHIMPFYVILTLSCKNTALINKMTTKVTFPWWHKAGDGRVGEFSSDYVHNDHTVVSRDGRGTSGTEEMCNGALTSLQDEEKK